jgi:nicotinate-nucleotide adenylyltransferase
MRIALFGGSFNPPHIGHLLVASWVLSARPVDQVWMVPTYSHAFGKALVDFELRCLMIEQAVEPLGDRAVVSRVEQEIGSISRTIDTVRHLIAERPSDELSLVIGADILLEASKWKQFEALQELVPFHVLGRDGVEVPGREFALSLPELSSTELRARLAAGDFDYCRDRMALSVLELIHEHHLYGASE